MGWAKGDKIFNSTVSLSGELGSDSTSFSYTQNFRVFEEYSVLNKRKRLVSGDFINLTFGINTPSVSDYITNQDMRSAGDFMYGHLFVIIKNLSETNPKSELCDLDAQFNIRLPYVGLYTATAEGRNANGSTVMGGGFIGGDYTKMGIIEPGACIATHINRTSQAYVRPYFGGEDGNTTDTPPLSYVDIEYSALWVGR